MSMTRRRQVPRVLLPMKWLSWPTGSPTLGGVCSGSEGELKNGTQSPVKGAADGPAAKRSLEEESSNRVLTKLSPSLAPSRQAPRKHAASCPVHFGKQTAGK